MDEAARAALAERLLAMADDELILAHRNSEWAGHAPILEEDIAFVHPETHLHDSEPCCFFTI